MRQGDFVTRKSYGGDVIFRIERADSQKAELRGVDYRLLADAPLSDLTTASPASTLEDTRSESPELRQTLQRLLHARRQEQVNQEYAMMNKTKASAPNYFEVPGKVLHIDGDPAYLRKSMQLYGQLRVPVEGYYVPEPQMADALYRLLPQVRPDIVVVTGHDAILKHRRSDMNSLSSYKNSTHFVNAVRTARDFERSRDAMIVVAGACQSHFEALLRAGANYASSPARVLIHALDPLCIAAKLSYTSIRKTVSMLDIVDLTITGLEGLGGVDTKGSYRVGVPGIVHADQ
ncbi:sporulation peptidase YabG [Paenibacillus athensensis]|uniref:Sporulation peptidase YabG n=1 Tax=Paenibacillus athensensis TaxID=1967502 RepID=A0A4Y8PX78_9BACL|nr:sporulation peptidase YabG [Paenibacillus athensensis]MCD1261898.1 sporulation peptidase YabG [Paenibacillus athensensis]